MYSKYLRRLSAELRFGARRILPAERILPNFLIIGTQKGGTTSLYRYLAEHPQVLPAFRKEVHFFCNQFDRGESFYRAHFATSHSAERERTALGLPVITGEATPYYLFHPLVPARASSLLPDARLIVLLRNPVDRAYSHYMHNRRKGREWREFEAAVEQEIATFGDETRALDDGVLKQAFNHQHYSYVQRGYYAEQLERWQQYFPRNRFLVIESDAFYTETGAWMERVCQFLHIDPPIKRGYPAHNRQEYVSELSPATRDWVASLYADHNERAFQWLGEKFAW
jgi:hypothetical protein